MSVKFKSSYLAELVNGALVGSDVEVSGISAVAEAKPSDITWAEDEKNFIKAEKSHACCILVQEGITSSKTLIKVKSPRIAFARILSLFASPLYLEAGIHPDALVDKGVKLGKDVSVGPKAVILKNAVIGKGVKIFPFVYIGADSIIGDDCIIYPHATVLDRSVIGKGAVIHSGAVIGSDGFGFVKEGEKHLKIPQIGNVVIKDDVEIGANTCVDRGTTGSTVIGAGTKIDNLVHIAHNVEIGKHCIIVAMSGLAGSTQIGDRVILAAQVGVIQHVKIGDDSIILGRAGVTKDIAPKSMVSGFPARVHKENMRIEASSSCLPEAIKTISQLKKKIEHLEKRIQEFEKA